jgi:hypothetical protein
VLCIDPQLALEPPHAGFGATAMTRILPGTPDRQSAITRALRAESAFSHSAQNRKIRELKFF